MNVDSDLDGEAAAEVDGVRNPEAWMPISYASLQERPVGTRQASPPLTGRIRKLSLAAHALSASGLSARSSPSRSVAASWDGSAMLLVGAAVNVRS